MMKLLVSLALCSLVACNIGPSRPAGIIPSTFDIRTRHPHSVQIIAAGWEESDPRVTSHLPDDVLIQALSESIRRTGVFAAVLPAKAEFELQVVILKIHWETEAALVDPTVTAQIDAHWLLRNVQKDQVVFQEIVSTSFKADRGTWSTRTRLAAERAASTNIKEGLRRLGLLEPTTLASLL